MQQREDELSLKGSATDDAERWRSEDSKGSRGDRWTTGGRSERVSTWRDDGNGGPPEGGAANAGYGSWGKGPGEGGAGGWPGSQAPGGGGGRWSGEGGPGAGRGRGRGFVPFPPGPGWQGPPPGSVGPDGARRGWEEGAGGPLVGDVDRPWPGPRPPPGGPAMPQSGRGFAVGRGRGADRWGPGGRGGAGGGGPLAFERTERLAMGQGLARHKYSRRELLEVYGRLHSIDGLAMPAAVSLGEMYGWVQTDQPDPSPMELLEEDRDATGKKGQARVEAMHRVLVSVTYRPFYRGEGPGGPGGRREGGGPEGEEGLSSAGPSLPDTPSAREQMRDAIEEGRLKARAAAAAASSAPENFWDSARQSNLLDGGVGGAVKPPPAQAPLPLPAALSAHDRWNYRDPHGQVQGPFSRQDMIDWAEAGYFPKELPITPVDLPNYAVLSSTASQAGLTMNAEGYMPLNQVMPLWRGSLKPTAPPAPESPAAQKAVSTTHVGGAGTVAPQSSAPQTPQLASLASLLGIGGPAPQPPAGPQAATAATQQRGAPGLTAAAPETPSLAALLMAANKERADAAGAGQAQNAGQAAQANLLQALFANLNTQQGQPNAPGAGTSAPAAAPGAAGPARAPQAQTGVQQQQPRAAQPDAGNAALASLFGGLGQPGQGGPGQHGMLPPPSDHEALGPLAALFGGGAQPPGLRGRGPEGPMPSQGPGPGFGPFPGAMHPMGMGGPLGAMLGMGPVGPGPMQMHGMPHPGMQGMGHPGMLGMPGPGMGRPPQMDPANNALLALFARGNALPPGQLPPGLHPGANPPQPFLNPQMHQGGVSGVPTAGASGPLTTPPASQPQGLTLGGQTFTSNSLGLQAPGAEAGGPWQQVTHPAGPPRRTDDQPPNEPAHNSNARPQPGAVEPEAPVGRPMTLENFLPKPPGPSMPPVWGGAAAAPPAAVAQGQSLKDIQDEEARRERKKAQERAAAAAAAAPPADATNGPRVPAAVVPPGPSGAWAPGSLAQKSLKEIQEEEERERQARPQQPQGPTMASLVRGGSGAALAAPPKSTWVGGAQPNAPAGASLRDIQSAELRRVQPTSAAGSDGADEELFWGTQASAAALATGARASAAAAVAAPKGGGAGAVPAPTAAGLLGPGASLSPSFREWCRQRMVELQGSEDLTLVEFLASLGSSSETAAYVELYLGKSAQTAAFTAEFLKRKLAEQAGQKIKNSSQTAASANKPSGPAWANATVPAKAGLQPMPVAAAQYAGGVNDGPRSAGSGVDMMASGGFVKAATPYQPPPSFNGDAFPSLPATKPAAAPTWMRMVPVSGGAQAAGQAATQAQAQAQAQAAAAAGKKGKGKKLLDSSLLGFSTGTDYAALEQP